MNIPGNGLGRFGLAGLTLAGASGGTGAGLGLATLRAPLPRRSVGGAAALARAPRAFF